LAKDVEVKSVKDNVVHIVQNFRNTHMPAAWCKTVGGKALVMPQDVRWNRNTMAYCLAGFLQHRSIILQVCKEDRGEIDTNIAASNEMQKIFSSG